MIRKRLGPYEITAKLGEGGMGEVYRATDTKLKRDVAIKVLPQGLTEDKERLARFEREAQLLAQLQHPNIASIYGMEESEGTRALILELVEGPTLAERLEQGPLPIEESLSISLQIAQALEEAHEKGIVHRDLKPQNIKASIEGKTKVLDFGLAKAMDSGSGFGSPADFAHSPTVTFGATREGVILGTAAYMSPEQARGGAVDKRADIWSFGVVLYEMLTGSRLFAGESVVDVLGAVMRQPIDFGRLPEAMPRRVEELLRHCLERNPKNRLRDIGDARIVLEETLAAPDETRPPGAAAAVPGLPAWRRFAPWIVALIAVAAVAALLVERSSRLIAPAAIAPRPVAAFRQLTFLPGGEATPSLAPEGESFVFAKRVDGQLDLFLQRVDGRNPVPLTTSCREDDREPAFSPDGRRIAYRSECAGGGIFVMGATGESARRVTDFGYSPAWSPDGRELAVVTEIPLVPYAGLSINSELWAVEIESGERRKVSEHDARLPSWSPDGRQIAFWGVQWQRSSNRELWVVAADGSDLAAERAVRSTEDPAVDWNPVWSPDGSWLYYSSTRGGTMNLWRLAIDPASGHGLGEPEPVVVPSSWAGWISFARDGRRFAFVDRNRRTTIFRAPFDSVRGELAGEPQPVETGSIEVWSDGIDLAPDGSSVLFSNVGMPQHLMVARAEGGELRQITEGPDRYRQARFSPDGSWIALQAARFPGRMALLRPDGSGLRELVTDRTEGWWPVWSPDGGRLAVSEEGETYILDLAATTPKGSTSSLPAPPDNLAFSPNTWSHDGRFLAGGLIASGAPAGIAIYSLTERSYRVVTSEADAENPKFLVDGRRLLWHTGRDIVLHDLDRALSRVLRSATPGSELASATLSYDGKWIAWLEVTDESDIWLASFEPVAPDRP